MLVLGINRILKWVQITTGWGNILAQQKKLTASYFSSSKVNGVR